MEEAERLKEEGNAAFRAKKFDEAVRLYGAAIAASPAPVSVYFSNRAAAFLLQNKLDEALADARESVRLDPSNSKGFLRVGKALYALGKYSEAIIDGFERALQAKPDEKTRQEAEDMMKKAKAAMPGLDEYKGKTFSYAHGKRHVWPDNRAEEMGIRNGQ